MSAEFDPTMPRQVIEGGINDKNSSHPTSAPKTKELMDVERDANFHDNAYDLVRAGCSGQDGGLNPISPS